MESLSTKRLGKDELIRKFDQALLEARVSPSVVFRTCDVNKNGSIQISELAQIVEKMNMNIDQETLIQIFMELDSNGNGMLEESEFYQLFKQSRS